MPSNSPLQRSDVVAILSDEPSEEALRNEEIDFEYFWNVVDYLLDHHLRLLSRFLTSPDHQNSFSLRRSVILKVDPRFALRLDLMRGNIGVEMKKLMRRHDDA